jgi:hypothetical protein
MDKYTKSQLYHCWYAIRQRCDNPKCCSYKYYGAKGITYTSRWNEFKNFLDDMLPSYPGYQRHMSIDRIDSAKDYSKENCQWMLLSEQNKKHTKIVRITYQGITLNVSEWERILGMKKTTLGARLRRGMNPIKALEIPIRENGIKLDGKRVLLKDLAKDIGIHSDTLTSRLKKGISFAEVLDKEYGRKAMSKHASSRKRSPEGTFV